MKNRMLAGKYKFHAAHAVPPPDSPSARSENRRFLVETVNTLTLNFIFDFLSFLCHNYIIQDNLKKSANIVTMLSGRCQVRFF